MPSFRDELSINDQEIAAALVGEERRQQDGSRTDSVRELHLPGGA